MLHVAQNNTAHINIAKYRRYEPCSSGYPAEPLCFNMISKLLLNTKNLVMHAVLRKDLGSRWDTYLKCIYMICFHMRSPLLGVDFQQRRTPLTMRGWNSLCTRMVRFDLFKISRKALLFLLDLRRRFGFGQLDIRVAEHARESKTSSE